MTERAQPEQDLSVSMPTGSMPAGVAALKAMFDEALFQACTTGHDNLRFTLADGSTHTFPLIFKNGNTLVGVEEKPSELTLYEAEPQEDDPDDDGGDTAGPDVKLLKVVAGPWTAGEVRSISVF
ncbi:hypothetical protein E3E12_02190 [Formicincola oecophyllae]|uniref:Uncharacterized protein n=1 Tax=Formicincola oecophyllae TaxID=2558361 RepID=A0A4Y6U738_9PROT|nr:hypothetical protein [Formicincola oecophyllae]QDH13203.1 hypothetical protein E3E12_02190 [Formicincola oecophyllae]